VDIIELIGHAAKHFSVHRSALFSQIGLHFCGIERLNLTLGFPVEQFHDRKMNVLHAQACLLWIPTGNVVNLFRSGTKKAPNDAPTPLETVPVSKPGPAFPAL
jgi:hypothetical protein